MGISDDDNTSISSSGVAAESYTTSINGSEMGKIYPSAEEGFSPVHELRAIPGLKDFTRSIIKDIDGKGYQDVDVVDEQGR
ncbi:hypothetical protein ACHAO9_012410 [Fusarium lateritium]